MKTEVNLIREIIRLRVSVIAACRAATGKQKKHLESALGWLNEAERQLAKAEEAG